MSFGFVASYSSKPLRARVPSAGWSALDVDIVKDSFNLALAYSFGFIKDWELGAVLPFAIYQSGSGLAPYASSHFEALARTALRDPRLGVAHALIARESSSPTGMALAARFDASLPLGSKEAFASEKGPVFIPAIAADFKAGRWLVGAEGGIRARASSDFLRSRMGTQGFFAVGIGLDLLGEALGVSAQAFALPILVSQPSGKPLVPAEWIAEVRSSPFANGDWFVALGGGSALPLSASAMTTPALRAVVSIRYRLSDDF